LPSPPDPSSPHPPNLSQSAGMRHADSGLRDPEPTSSEAPLSSARWASLAVLVGGAREVAIRFAMRLGVNGWRRGGDRQYRLEVRVKTGPSPSRLAVSRWRLISASEGRSLPSEIGGFRCRVSMPEPPAASCLASGRPGWGCCRWPRTESALIAAFSVVGALQNGDALAVVLASADRAPGRQRSSVGAAARKGTVPRE